MERFAGEAAVRQILSGDFTVRRFPQTLGVPLAGNGRGGIERFSGIGSAGWSIGNHHSNLGSYFSHCRRVVHTEVFHEEREYVTALVTHEAIVHLLLRNDREVAVRSTVKGARPAVIRTCAPQRHVLPEHVDQIRGVPYLLYQLVRDDAHHLNSAIVTPQPPWCGGEVWNEATRPSRARTADTRSRNTPVPLP